MKDVLNFVDGTTDEGTEVTEVAAEMKEGLAVGVGTETEAKQGDLVVQNGEGAKSSWAWHPRAMQNSSRI